MKLNVYSQELTHEVHLISKNSRVGRYHAVQLTLHTPFSSSHVPKIEELNAVTFWLPKSAKKREELARTLERMAQMVRNAPPETGLD